MPKDEEEHVIGGINRRSLLRGGLLAGAGIATVGTTSAVFTGTAKASTAGQQPDWAYCVLCSTMWYEPGQLTSACAAAYPALEHATNGGDYNYGQYHDFGGYTYSTNPQAGWRWCKWCQGLWFTGDKVANACAGTFRTHVAGSNSNYELYVNETTGSTSMPQPYWRWCGNCGLLYWQGPSGSSGGYCPEYTNLGFPPNRHQAGSDTNYCIYWNGTY